MGRAAALKEVIAREEELERLRAERELAESVSEARRTRFALAGLALEEAEEFALTPAQQRANSRGPEAGAKRSLADMTTDELQS